MVITLPDVAAERVTAAAAARGVTVEAVVVELVMDLPGKAVADDARDALEAFLGSGNGDGTRFEIHEARRELAAKKWAQGIENL